MTLGAYDYLIKPADIDALVEKIKLAFDHKTTLREKQQLTSTAGGKHSMWGKWRATIRGLFNRGEHAPTKPSGSGKTESGGDKP
jgi:DNA-binding NtrC family response regulator